MKSSTAAEERVVSPLSSFEANWVVPRARDVGFKIEGVRGLK
jgi:hypothetical protein